MRKLGYIVLGLALLVGALSFAGYRHLTPQHTGAPSASASRSVHSSGPASRTNSLSGVQLFEMGLNAANVIVGILGIWLTVRGVRAERRADAMAFRHER